jgi:hypothetical protein
MRFAALMWQLTAALLAFQLYGYTENVLTLGVGFVAVGAAIMNVVMMAVE